MNWPGSADSPAQYKKGPTNRAQFELGLATPALLSGPFSSLIEDAYLLGMGSSDTPTL